MMRTRRRLNLRFALALALAIVLLGGSIHLVHAAQERRLAAALLTRADLAEKKGDLAQAETYLRRYVAARPEDDEAFGRYALLLVAAADDDPQRIIRALAVLERAIGRDPARIDLRRRAVDLSMRPGVDRHRAADDHLETLLKAKPDDGELEELRGLCSEALALSASDPQAQLRAAEGWYAKAIAHAPSRIAAHERRAALLRGPLARTPNAEQVADALMDARNESGGVVARNPRSAPAHLARARYRRAHGIDGADADVARALELAPDDSEALLASAEQATRASDLDAARRHLERGLDLASGSTPDIRLYQALAVVEVRAGRRDEAAKVLGLGLKAHPGDIPLLWDLADVLLGSGRADDAETQALAVLAKDRTFHPAALAFLTGRIEVARGHWSKAVEHLERARGLAGTSPALAELARRADLLLADGYGRLGNPDRRVAASRRVLESDPKSLPAQTFLTSGLLSLGRQDDALEQLRKAGNLDPTARLTAARLLAIEQLRLPERERNWGEFDRMLDEAGRAGPESVDLALLRAESLAVRGTLDQARTALEAARAKYPTATGPWIDLAGLAAQGPKPEAALAILDEAQKALGDRVELRLARARYFAQKGGDDARKALQAMADGVDSATGQDRLTLLDGLANAFQIVGDRDRARDLWTRLAEAKPDDPRVATLLFDLALKAGPADGPEVEKAIARLRLIEGDDGPLARYAEAAKIVALARSGDRSRLDQARRLLDAVRLQRPEWPRVPLLEAEIAELEGDGRRAADAFLAAIEKGDRDPEVIRRAVQALYQTRRYSDADRLIQKMAGHAPAEGTIGKLAAERLLHGQDREGALERALKAVPADSANYRDHLWLGQIQAIAGRPAEAEAHFRHAVELAGDRPEVWVNLIQHLVNTGARKSAEDALAQAEKTIKPEEAPTALALCYEMVGRSADAETLHIAAAKSRPDDPSGQIQLALFYRRTGQAEKAEASIRTLLDDPKSPDQTIRWARRQMALVLASGNDGRRTREGLKLVDQNLQAKADSVEDLQVRAVLLAKQIGNRRDGIKAYEDLMRLGPLSPGEKLALAELHEIGHNPAKAGEILRSLVAAGGAAADDPRVLALYTRNLLARGQPSEAETWLTRLEKVQPNNPVAVELRARLLAARGDGPAVVALLRQFAQRKDQTKDKDKAIDQARVAGLLESLGQPDAAEALYREDASRPGSTPERTLILAEFLARRGRAAEALEACERVRKSCRPAVLSHTAVAIAHTAKLDEAQSRKIEGWLDEALRKEPSNVAIEFDVANLKIDQGRYQEAESLLREIHNRHKDRAAPLNNLAWLLALREGRGADALDLANRAIALEGADPDSLDTRALAHLALGRTEPAIKDLEEAVAVRPTSDNLLHLARAYAQASRKKEAAEALERARRAGLDERTIHPLEQDGYRRLLADLART